MKTENRGSIMYSLMLYVKASSTLNFWRREESNINPINLKKRRMKLVHDGKKTCEELFPDAWSEFVISIAKISRQAEADKY